MQHTLHWSVIRRSHRRTEVPRDANFHFHFFFFFFRAKVLEQELCEDRNGPINSDGISTIYFNEASMGIEYGSLNGCLSLVLKQSMCLYLLPSSIWFHSFVLRPALCPLIWSLVLIARIFPFQKLAHKGLNRKDKKIAYLLLPNFQTEDTPYLFEIQCIAGSCHREHKRNLTHMFVYKGHIQSGCTHQVLWPFLKGRLLFWHRIPGKFDDCY